MGSVKAEVRGLRTRALSTSSEKEAENSKASPNPPGLVKELGLVLALPEIDHGGFVY